MVIGFDENKNNSTRKSNDKYYKSSKYDYLYTSGSEDSSILNYLNNFIERTSKTDLEIAIDYSSMTRIWYGTIIDFLIIISGLKKYRYISYMQKLLFLLPQKLRIKTTSLSLLKDLAIYLYLISLQP